MTTLLDERGPGVVPPESILERDLFTLLSTHGIAAPERQHPLPRLDSAAGRVDAAWPEIRLIVEVDGRRWHQRMTDMKKDRDRDLQAAAPGWMVIRLLHEHIVGAPEQTARELQSIIATRAAQLGIVA